MTTFADYFGVLTYIDPLIYYKPESHSNWMHRELAVKRDIFLKKYIHGIDKAIFQELPIFEPDILGSAKEIETPKEDLVLNGNKPEPEKSGEYAHILKDWIHEKWTDLLIRLFDTARIHKWCIPQLYNTKPFWRVFTYREVKEIRYDENDNPISADVIWTKQLPCAATYNLHSEVLNFIDEDRDKLDKNGNLLSQALFVNFGSDLDERIEGTDIENIWSASVYMRYIMLDIVRNSAKSSGFYWIKYGSQVTDAFRDKVQAMFDKANSGNAVAASENVIDDMQAMYMKNPEFPIEALDKFLKLFSGACDLPLLYFNGEKEVGSIFGEASGGMAQINLKKREIFGKFKQAILTLVKMRWGIECTDVFPNIEEVEGLDEYKEDIIQPSGGGDSSSKELKKTRLQS